MITVRLRDFLREGRLGEVDLEMSRAQVEERLGKPPNLQRGTSWFESIATWRYGDIELYFGWPSEKLESIFLREFTVPRGGGKVRLEPWIISARLGCARAREHLETAGIACHEQDWPLQFNGVRLTTQAGVVLEFWNRNPDEVRLRSVRRSALPL